MSDTPAISDDTIRSYRKYASADDELDRMRTVLARFRRSRDNAEFCARELLRRLQLAAPDDDYLPIARRVVSGEIVAPSADDVERLVEAALAVVGSSEDDMLSREFVPMLSYLAALRAALAPFEKDSR